jgi:hypothetical protein
MAGSVIIDDKTSVAFNSRGFDLVVESIRDALKINDPDLIAPVYESMDVGCMPFICLDNLNEKDIQRFFLVAKKSFFEWRQHNSESFPEWTELIEKLESDERIKHI